MTTPATDEAPDRDWLTEALIDDLRGMKVEVCDCRWLSYPHPDDIAVCRAAAKRLSDQSTELVTLRAELARSREALKEAIDIFDGIDRDVVGISATLDFIEEFTAKYGENVIDV